MKEHKKSTVHIQKYSTDVGQLSCVLSNLPCFCTFLAPSLLEFKFYRKFFPSFYSLFWHFYTNFDIEDERY